jgi:hypothetical protein
MMFKELKDGKKFTISGDSTVYKKIAFRKFIDPDRPDCVCQIGSINQHVYPVKEEK